MSSISPVSSSRPRASSRWPIRIHRWLGLIAALLWLVQAVTGSLISFHFELEDAMLSTASRPTDLAAIERRLDELAAAGPQSKVIWIWTTAGLDDRYVINFIDGDGNHRRARIDGWGEILRNRKTDDHSFLSLMRELHLTLMAGKIGHWILAIAGGLLVTNLVFGLVVAWPRRGSWLRALTPTSQGDRTATAYSWHRALGLWAAIPTIFVVGTGTLILFEHQIADLVGAPDVALPANPPEGAGIGFAAAARAAVAAIPGSRFVGTTVPSASDASYYAWVRAPGELYRGGYGGSLVVVDANHGSIRGAYPATEAAPAKAFVASFYPLHTGEAGRTIGRVLVMIVGFWLTALIVFGVLLWFRRSRRRSSGRNGGTRLAGSGIR